MPRKDLTFRVFVSSTFSDLIAERNALQKKVFPQLREFCQQRGARFQAIDLRWGVAEEAALDQQTMNICIRELHRCQQLSPKPNFIVLLGDRYGWRPLPPQIEATEFEGLLQRLDVSEKQRLSKWYRRDENAVPSEYCLLPRTGEFVDQSRWMLEELELRAILVKAVEQTPSMEQAPRRRYYQSATHQEIEHGALKAKDPKEHVFCYFREASGLPEDERAKQYRELVNGQIDTDARDRLNGLKKELENLLPREHVHNYPAAWRNERVEWDLGQFCEDVRKDLEGIIQKEVDTFSKRPEVEREQEAHREFAEDRARHFVGRRDILDRINAYLNSDETKPLIVFGKSGAGKTALTAKAWLNTCNNTNAIARFIGATPGSCELRTLLTSLCRQMGFENVPSEMNELVKTFRDRLSPLGQDASEPDNRPQVVLVLDALDQLSHSDNARMLYWLPRELAPGVKLVLSVLTLDQATERSPARDNPFDIAGRIWSERLVELGPLDEAAGSELLRTWLREAGRTLTSQQWDHVITKFRECPLPLYLKLAFEETRRWKSWDGLPTGADAEPGLSNSVEGILEDLFHRLEEGRHHGPVLASRALGFLATGKNGLTEDELLDVLSANGDVMKYFYDQSPTERGKPPEDRIKSLPVVIWSRLYADLEPYMTRRRADGTVVMDFYHRQVGEGVRRRYLSEDVRASTHLALAEYFHKLDYWAESLEAQRARAKRIPPTPRPANVRKVVELPYHRLEAAKLLDKDNAKSPHWDAVANLLTDWQFLEAKTEADPNFQEQESGEPRAESSRAKS